MPFIIKLILISTGVAAIAWLAQKAFRRLMNHIFSGSNFCPPGGIG